MPILRRLFCRLFDHRPDFFCSKAGLFFYGMAGLSKQCRHAQCLGNQITKEMYLLQQGVTRVDHFLLIVQEVSVYLFLINIVNIHLIIYHNFLLIYLTQMCNYYSSSFNEISTCTCKLFTCILHVS